MQNQAKGAQASCTRRLRFARGGVPGEGDGGKSAQPI